MRRMGLVRRISRVANRRIRLRNTATGGNEWKLNPNLVRFFECLVQITIQPSDRERVRMSLWRHFNNVPSEQVDALVAKRPALHEVKVLLFGPLLHVG